MLRPAPVIGLTATATPLVQDDIVEQLGLADCNRFIHGFRRENIAIEIVEAPPSIRGEKTRELLQEPDFRPAIVYCGSRKNADALAAELKNDFPAAPYHAGMASDDRDLVQDGFLNGRFEVIVATIAFGMGVDKPDIRTIIHTALPGTLEGYYQEIGRAGRDGEPSRAVLMYSWADRRTHEFFWDRGLSRHVPSAKGSGTCSAVSRRRMNSCRLAWRPGTWFSKRRSRNYGSTGEPWSIPISAFGAGMTIGSWTTAGSGSTSWLSLT